MSPSHRWRLTGNWWLLRQGESAVHSEDSVVELKECHCFNSTKEETENDAGHREKTLHTHPGENDHRMWS